VTRPAATQRLGAAVADLYARLRTKGPVVLLYHRVASTTDDPFRLCVSPHNFAEQLDVLRRSATVVPMKRLVNADARPALPKRAVAITFDDGYADNLTAAKPLLAAAAASATVFVTTGALGEEFWWDALERILNGPEPLPARLALRLQSQEYEWETGTGSRTSGAARSRGDAANTAIAGLYRQLHLLLKATTPSERSDVLAQLAALTGSAARVPTARRALSPGELCQLVDGGLVTVGAHSINHPRLASLSPAEQHTEIRGSRADLEAITGGRIDGFAYPYGQRYDFDTTSVAVLKELGFSYACAAFPGTVALGQDVFRIPRLWVEDWDGDEFAHRLARWLPRAA
jgi:peptidoglycan/xylan/chitin deacetylase (PgdA/CDA1 family)